MSVSDMPRYSKKVKGRKPTAGECMNRSACSVVRVAVGDPSARFLNLLTCSFTARTLNRYSENADTMGRRGTR